MSPYKKNIFVGLTVLVALILLGWMILRFSDAPFRLFAKPQMTVHLVAEAAEGISEGSPIYYLGVQVGRVGDVKRSEDQMSVTIDAILDKDPPLPANIEAFIRTQLIGGGASISLALSTPDQLFPATQGTLATTRPRAVPRGRLEDGQVLHAKFIGVDILPPEITALATDLTQTSAQLRRVANQIEESQIMGRLAGTIDTLKLRIDDAGKVIRSVDELVNDPAMRKDLHETVANFNAASKSAVEIGQDVQRLAKNANTRMDELAGSGNRLLTTSEARVNDVSKQLVERLVQLDGIFQRLDSVARKFDEGKGTASLLVNDPALYESLLDASKELKLSIQDIRRTIQGWEQEGLPFRLK